MKKLFLLLTITLMLNAQCAFAESENPIFLTITAESCQTCQKLKPVLESLESSYEGKVTFITLNVSSRASLEEAKVKAEEYGLSDYFNKNRHAIPKVGIFCPGGKVEKEFLGETDQSAYETAINELLADSAHLCSL